MSSLEMYINNSNCMLEHCNSSAMNITCGECKKKMLAEHNQVVRKEREHEILSYLVENAYIRYGFSEEYLSQLLEKKIKNELTL